MSADTTLSSSKPTPKRAHGGSHSSTRKSFFLRDRLQTLTLRLTPGGEWSCAAHGPVRKGISYLVFGAFWPSEHHVRWPAGRHPVTTKLPRIRMSVVAGSMHHCTGVITNIKVMLVVSVRVDPSRCPCSSVPSTVRLRVTRVGRSEHTNCETTRFGHLSLHSAAPPRYKPR